MRAANRPLDWPVDGSERFAATLLFVARGTMWASLRLAIGDRPPLAFLTVPALAHHESQMPEKYNVEVTLKINPIAPIPARMALGLHGPIHCQVSASRRSFQAATFRHSSAQIRHAWTQRVKRSALCLPHSTAHTSQAPTQARRTLPASANRWAM
jgi:hypothetical protein